LFVGAFCMRVVLCSLFLGERVRSGSSFFAMVLVSSRSLLASSFSASIDLAVDSKDVDIVVVNVLIFSKFFVVDSVIIVAFVSFFFVGVLHLNVMGDGAVVVVLDLKGAGGASFPMVGIHVG